MTKLAKIKQALLAGDQVAALRIAAKFPDLGEHREAITRAWASLQSPQFYREIGRDPEALFTAGVAAIRQRYGI